MIDAAERGLANGSMTAIQAIDMTAEALLMARDLALTPGENVWRESKSRPTHYGSMINFCAYMVHGQPQLGLMVFEKALKQWPNDTYMLTRKSHFLTRNTDYSGALKEIRKAMTTTDKPDALLTLPLF